MSNEKKKPEGVMLSGSKSIAIRTLIISTYLEESVDLINFPNCDDASTLKDALIELGFSFDEKGEVLTLSPPHKANLNPHIYLKDSAAALRFLVVRLAGWKDMQAVVSLSSQLRKRPIEPLCKVLRACGAEIDFNGEQIQIRGKESLRLNSEALELLNQSSRISSQFLSAVLLNIPVLRGKPPVRFSKGTVSKSYIKLTIGVMRDFGASFSFHEGNLGKIGEMRYENPGVYEIEPDFSSACYIWALAALGKTETGVVFRKSNSLQPDYRFPEILTKMGCRVVQEDETISVRSDILTGIQANMVNMPDQVPTLALLALFAEGKTTISNIDHLHHKESDRIVSLVTEFSKIGASVEYKDRQLTIYPLKKEVPATCLECHGDHRIAMTLSILKVMFPQLSLAGTDCIGKSFPDFDLYLEKALKNNNV
jgi:3-phosphoshikimate 1-carboxyvinyltransferase